MQICVEPARNAVTVSHIAANKSESLTNHNKYCMLMDVQIWRMNSFMISLV